MNILNFSIKLNFEFFIAKRITRAKDYKNSISAPIIKIAISAIALGVVMMLIAVATGTGLQRKIRERFRLSMDIYRFLTMIPIARMFP